jgi:predicted  nucleic acid-binding Zn-ribbon protein
MPAATTTREISTLLRLAELDAALLEQSDGQRVPVRAGRRDARGDDNEVAGERHALGVALSPDILEAYNRALRAGRRPAVVRLVASVCSGCHVRLHSTLEQKIRRRRGVAACPHCLRLVYDAAWLDGAEPR